MTPGLPEHLQACRSAWLAQRGIPELSPHPAASDFRQASFDEIMRMIARSDGLPAGLSRAAMLDGLFSNALAAGQRNVASHLTLFFSSLAEAAVLAGWNAAAQPWQQLCRRGRLSDFRPTGRVGLDLGDLTEVGEAAEVSRVQPGERQELLQARSFSTIAPISRRVLLNRELDVMDAIPFQAGQSAGRTVQTQLSALLNLNGGLGPTMTTDSVTLFSAAHANVPASGGSLDVTTLGAGLAALRQQREPAAGSRLNIPPRYLLVPAAQEAAARVLAASMTPSGGGELAVVVDPNLASTTAWYVFGDPGICPTLEVAFLAGQDTPVVETRSRWESDAIEHRISLDFDVAALDHKGCFRNPGV